MKTIALDKKDIPKWFWTEQIEAQKKRAEQAEALIKRIRQVAIHTPQGNAVIPSSMILEKGDE